MDYRVIQKMILASILCVSIGFFSAIILLIIGYYIYPAGIDGVLGNIREFMQNIVTDIYIFFNRRK
jgi:hypothetical protein